MYIYLQALGENVVNDLILSYLIHNGYRESSESFIACTEMNRPAEDLEKMEKRISRFIIVVFRCSRLVEDFWFHVNVIFLACALQT